MRIIDQEVNVQDKALARRVTVLHTMPLFADLPEKEIETIVHDLRLKEYGRDEIIFRQGDESREVYFVLKGKGAHLHHQPVRRRNVDCDLFHQRRDRRIGRRGSCAAR